MFEKKYRLGEVRNFKAAHAFSCQFFTLRVIKNNLLYNRYGFVVSKKIDKRATVRNRLRRRMSSCIENLVNKMKKGYDMMFIIKQPALEIDNNFCSKIQEVLKKEGLFI